MQKDGVRGAFFHLPSYFPLPPMRIHLTLPCSAGKPDLVAPALARADPGAAHGAACVAETQGLRILFDFPLHIMPYLELLTMDGSEIRTGPGSVGFDGMDGASR